MAINPNISLAVRGVELPDPLAQYGKFAAIQQAQQQNQLAQMQMQEAQAAMQERNALRQLNPAAPDYTTQVMRINPELGSQLTLRAKQQMQAERASAASEAETQTKNLTNWQSLARDYARTPTNDVVTDLAKRAVALGITDENTATSQLQQILAMPLDQRSQILSQFGAPAYVPKEATPRASQLRTPEEEAQAIRIAAASRAPVQPKEPPAPTAPVAVVDPASGQVKYVTREEALGKTPAAAIEGLTPKERQTREAKYPQATSAVKTFDNTSDTLVKDLEKLANHPGLSSITGIAAGRLPGITKEGREAEALFDKIVARGGFQELQNMRQASPTGGALGNVSNQEGSQLRQAFAALDRRQDASSVRSAITDAIAQIRTAKQNIRDAYDLTYEYKQKSGSGAPNIDDLLNKYK